MRYICLVIFSIIIHQVSSQELYVFSEPASNMPAKSLSVKVSNNLLNSPYGSGKLSRFGSELMFGVNKNLMVHAFTGFARTDLGQSKWDGMRLYAKYRFLSVDGLYTHFRMAAFAEAAMLTKNNSYREEIDFDGDKEGFGFGVIATQLLHRLAISSTLGFRAVPILKVYPPSEISTAVNYSLSAGYLVLPRVYKNYKQVNLNLYMEMLGQNATDTNKHYIDLAPAAQLIFNSQAKLNLGYRFQVDGNMTRMSRSSWLLSFEWLFLNVFKK